MKKKSSGLVNAFLYNQSKMSLILVQKDDLADRPFALPGGRVEKGESIAKATARETKAEVGGDAWRAVESSWREIEIDRGEYLQTITIAEFDGKVGKKGLIEKDNAGAVTEVLGPPTWVLFDSIKRGIVQMGRSGYSKICKSHMNAIHECLAMLAEDDPDTFQPLADATEKFAFDKRKV